MTRRLGEDRIKKYTGKIWFELPENLKNFPIVYEKIYRNEGGNEMKWKRKKHIIKNCTAFILASAMLLNLSGVPAAADEEILVIEDNAESSSYGNAVSGGISETETMNSESEADISGIEIVGNEDVTGDPGSEIKVGENPDEQAKTITGEESNIITEIETKDIPEEETEELEIQDANYNSVAAASDLTSGDYTYFVSGNNAVITKYTGSASSLDIPSSIGGYTVTEIGSSAFSDCTSLTSVSLPASLTSIGNSAFRGCTGLEEVIFNKSSINMGNTLSIEHYAFEDCNSLKDITLPGNLEYIGCDVFTSPYITSITVPKSVTSMDHGMDSAFSRCLNLETVTFESGMTTIPSYALYNCKSVKKTIIPESVTEIGSCAFYGCTGGQGAIDLPASLTSIGSSAFEACTGLTSVSLPASLTSIGNSAFRGCTGLEEVIFNKSSINMGNTLSIEHYAFEDCNSLKDITLPGNLEYIGCDVFTSPYITSITVPKSVTSMDHGMDSAFSRCLNLETVTFESGMTTIPSYALYNCKSIKKVMIPSSVKEISSYAFDGCTDFMIYGVSGSYAETYAKENNIPFAVGEKDTDKDDNNKPDNNKPVEGNFIKKKGKYYYNGGTLKIKTYELDGPLVIDKPLTLLGRKNKKTSAMIIKAKTVTINANVNLLKDSELISEGNLKVASAGSIEMQKDSVITVGKDFTFESNYLSMNILNQGTIWVAGNVNLKKNFCASGKNTIKLTGSKVQKVKGGKDCKIALLDVCMIDLKNLKLSGKCQIKKMQFEYEETPSKEDFDDMFTFSWVGKKKAAVEQAMRDVLFTIIYSKAYKSTDLLEGFYDSMKGIATFTKSSFTLPAVVKKNNGYEIGTVSGDLTGFGLCAYGKLIYKNSTGKTWEVIYTPSQNYSDKVVKKFMKGLKEGGKKEIEKQKNDCLKSQFFSSLASVCDKFNWKVGSFLCEFPETKEDLEDLGKRIDSLNKVMKKFY